MRREYCVADIALASEGLRRMEWVWQYMPVMRLVREKMLKDQPLAGHTVAVCLHLEAKTACLLRVLRDLGAVVVAAGSNPLSTQDPVCAALAQEGIHVYSHHGMDTAAYTAYLREMLSWRPDIVIDDGGDTVAMIHDEFLELIPGILGGCEETTTGIKRLRAMDTEGVLKIPMMAVNDALSKHLYDNRYGTGQSVWDSIMRTTNVILNGKAVVIVGYGWCGRGVAMRAAGLGARVIVVEIDPHKALEAHMDGYSVMDMEQAAACGDIFVTVTGNTKVIRKEHFLLMKDGVLLANAGHFDVEVYVPHLREIASKTYESRHNVMTFERQDGCRLHLLGEGRLVNLAAGDGHPAEIMDLSFSVQLFSAIFLTQNKLPAGLTTVPEEIDREIAMYKLESLGLKLEKLTPEQEAYLRSWRE